MIDTKNVVKWLLLEIIITNLIFTTKLHLGFHSRVKIKLHLGYKSCISITKGYKSCVSFTNIQLSLTNIASRLTKWHLILQLTFIQELFITVSKETNKY